MSASRGKPSVALLSVVLCMWPAAAPAQAGAGPAEDSSAARAITTGQQAIQAYEQGKWSDALRLFREADALYHSPVFALFRARCQRQLGQLLEARAELQQLVSESLPATAAAPWVKAQADARLELAELAHDIPTVTVAIEGASRQARLTLDDQPAEPGRAIELNPGQHRATVTDGARHRETSFILAVGARSSLAISLTPPETPKPSAPTKTTPILPKPPAAAPHRGPYLPGWILVGSGALALASGGVVGTLALNERSSLSTKVPARCEQDRCLEMQRSAVEAHFEPARDLALACDILWISGAVLTGAGITLLMVESRSSASTTALRVSPSGASVRLSF